MYHNTLDAKHFFGGSAPLDSACRIRVYETLHAREGLPTVIIASQIPGCAASVTNHAEDIATEAVRMQRARRRLEPGDPRYGFVWVEHYPPGLLRLEPDGLFRPVTFRQTPDGGLASPEWGQRITREQVERSLIGVTLAP